MGTSKSFSDVNHSMVPNWGNLSSSLTSNCSSSALSSQALQSILSNFVSALSGAVVGGRGGSKAGGRSSIKSAKKIGQVLSNFVNSGYNLGETLANTGFSDLNAKTVGDIINHLIEYCSGDATSIDDSAAKEATRLLLEDIIENAESIEQVEQLLHETLESTSVSDIIVRYFGIYINELLSKWFYEKLIKSKGEHDCNNLFRQIREFIMERIETINDNYPLQNIDWGSDEADRLIKDIQQDVLTVFE